MPDSKPKPIPERLYFKVMRYERQIYMGVLAWLLLGSYVAAALRSVPMIYSNPFLYWISGIFSLSGIISSVISAVSGLMLDFWQLIPFLRI